MFSESALCHREMLGLINFGFYLCFCIVNMVSIQKYLSNFSGIPFYELLKVTNVFNH